ncbi:hypothetical protein FRC04_007286 [Tulasnella sp. 424]|nr:hypothetical protein FRC04_007286 [Tulasnella sp. 424]
MSTVQRPRIYFADILFCLLVFIVSTSVLIAHDFGLIKFQYISSTFFPSSPPSPLPPSSPSIGLHSGYRHHSDRTLNDFKLPACVALFLLTLSVFLYIRKIYGRRFDPSCYPSFELCVAQARISLLLQDNQSLADGLQKATADVKKATADVKKEQGLSKFYREMVEGACNKFVELQSTSAEALRRSKGELDESKGNVARLNALVKSLRQDLDVSQANLLQRLTYSAKEHQRGMEAADRQRLKAIANAHHAQAEAKALHSEAVSAHLELDAMRVEIDLVRRDLGASKRRAKAARNEAKASHAENTSLRNALKEKHNRLLAMGSRGVPANSPPLTPPGSVTPEEVKFVMSPKPGATSFSKSIRSRLGLKVTKVELFPVCFY